MITRNQIMNKFNDLKPVLSRDYAEKIGLCGSFLDDSFTENSDID